MNLDIRVSPHPSRDQKLVADFSLPKTGIEQPAISNEKTCFDVAGGTDSGAVGARDDGLDRLAKLWPMLSVDDRAALLAHAEHLAALRDGVSRDSATGETSSR